eukprot:snap_masked-scaffold_3-processed-gene-16.50-mRNA-1 protein AED:0.04 eAED:0.04 QI:0/-1/0/1/-1/1/1/0/566
MNGSLSKRDRLLSFSETLRLKQTSNRYDGFIDLDAAAFSKRALFSSFRQRKFESSGELTSTAPRFRPTGETRILDRENPFYQSTGNMRINHFAKGETRNQVLALYSDDWFHVLLSIQTSKILLLLTTIITFGFLIFSGFYIAVDRSSDQCRLGPIIEKENGESSTKHIGFQAAFGFSLITSSTIGYGFVGSGDTFYFDCKPFVVVVYFQAVVSMLLNALVVGIILQRVGRANTRAHQVIFSNKAVIRNINGKLYFSVQVFDLDRRHPVVEAHIRLYAIINAGKQDEQFFRAYKTQIMRIQTPNDELGSPLFLSVPCITVHQIDAHSPLFPREQRENIGVNSSYHYTGLDAVDTMDETLVLREADCEAGARSSCFCPVCGDDFLSTPLFDRHVTYYSKLEKKQFESSPLEEREKLATNPAFHVHLLKEEESSSPTVSFANGLYPGAIENGEKRHSKLKTLFNNSNKLLRSSSSVEGETRSLLADVERHIRESNLEIVVLVEGIEARSSNTFQARHSYKINDIEFDKFFAPCMEVAPNGLAQINLNYFHKTVPVPKYVSKATPVQSRS